MSPDAAVPTLAMVGLGRMGAPMAANLLAAGFDLIAFDLAGTDSRAPRGARIAASVAAAAIRADVVCTSLPDGAAVRRVAEQVAAAPGRRADTFVDFSTIGVEAAQAVATICAGAGIAYLDAPVSGGVPGARAGTLACMAAGPRPLFDALTPVLAAVARHGFHVGERPGQGQALKLCNNFLSGTALVATSEALACAVRHGLDPALVIDVLNASSGRNTATADKFPRAVLPGTYDAGFAAALMAKDLRLYLAAAEAETAPRAVGRAVHDVWAAFGAAHPADDFSRIYPFVRDGGAPGS